MHYTLLYTCRCIRILFAWKLLSNLSHFAGISEQTKFLKWNILMCLHLVCGLNDMPRSTIEKWFIIIVLFYHGYRSNRFRSIWIYFQQVFQRKYTSLWPLCHTNLIHSCINKNAANKNRPNSDVQIITDSFCPLQSNRCKNDEENKIEDFYFLRTIYFNA